MSVRGPFFVLILMIATVARAAPSEPARDAIVAQLPPTVELRSLELPHGWSGRARVQVEGAMPTHAGRAWIRLRRGEGRNTDHGYALVELVELGPALELVRDVHEGELMLPSMVRIATHPSDPARPALRDPRQLVGRRAQHDMSSGTFVIADDLVAQPVVRRGSPVHVIVARGGIRVVANAQLERDAVPGEMTAARVVETRALVTGRMVDAQTVLNEGEL